MPIRIRAAIPPQNKILEDNVDLIDAFDTVKETVVGEVERIVR